MLILAEQPVLTVGHDANTYTFHVVHDTQHRKFQNRVVAALRHNSVKQNVNIFKGEFVKALSIFSLSPPNMNGNQVFVVKNQ